MTQQFYRLVSEVGDDSEGSTQCSHIGLQGAEFGVRRVTALQLRDTGPDTPMMAATSAWRAGPRALRISARR